MFVRTDLDRRIRFLAFFRSELHWRTKRPKRDLRFPAGSSEGNESVAETLCREMQQEIALEGEKFEFRYLTTVPVYWEVARDDVTNDPTFLKTFFALEIINGRIRETEKTDDAGTDREETLGIPVWFDPAGLHQRMQQLNSPRGHCKAVAAAVAFLAKTDHSLSTHYAGLLTEWVEPVADPEILDYLVRGRSL